MGPTLMAPFSREVLRLGACFSWLRSCIKAPSMMTVCVLHFIEGTFSTVVPRAGSNNTPRSSLCVVKMLLGYLLDQEFVARSQKRLQPAQQNT